MVQVGAIFKSFITYHILFLQVAVVFSVLQIEPRIINGADGNFEEVPFLVYIDFAPEYCGGSLVSDRHIITAAHCVVGKNAKQFRIYVNSATLSEMSNWHEVSEIIVHPNFDPKGRGADIAVMKLKSPLTGPPIRVATLCEVPVKTGDAVKVYGWGTLIEESSVMPDQLQTVTTRVIDHDQCKSTYTKFNEPITENMFCAIEPGKGPCRGDSGGPALVNGKLCGVVSWGTGCATVDFAGVYADITKLRPFLNEALKN